MCLGGLATFAVPRVSFAQVPRRGRFVFVLLRGGVDGLAAVVPYGDPGVRALRAALAFDGSELVALTDDFGLAPGLAPLRELWDADELTALHAMAIPYRTRSHFDGQAMLETGLDKPVGASDGWLNRLLQVMDGERSGIAIAAGHAALDDRLVRRADLVAGAARRGGRRVSGAAGTLYRADQALHRAGSRPPCSSRTRGRGADGAGGAGPRRGASRR